VLGYRMSVTRLSFVGGLVDLSNGTVTLPGCVSYSQWRYYEVRTLGMADAHVTALITAEVEGVYAAAGRLPTASDYDVIARPPNPGAATPLLSLSPCDVALPNVWHIGVHLGEAGEAAPRETLFSLSLSTRTAAAPLGATVEGSACCGDFAYWRVPQVPADAALLIIITELLIISRCLPTRRSRST
jgi:hypothetical protein